MERIPIPFVGSTKEARSKIDNAQLSENMYLEFDDSGKTPTKLYRAPGLKWKMSAGVGPNRSNIVEYKGSSYFVSRNELIKANSSFDKTTIGALNSSSGVVSIVAMRDYVALVDGTNGYTTQGTSLTQIADADFPNGAKHITVMNGRAIVDGTSLDTFWISDDEDPTSWNALNFASAEKRPDDLVLPYAIEDILWLLGKYSAEPWVYNANVDFPYAPIEGAVANWGIQAGNSLAEGDKTLFWLAKSKSGQNVVVMARGTQLQEISPPWLVYQIGRLSTTDDAEGFFYQQAGHAFYVLTFPKALKTWVYDLTTGEWHTRQTWEKGRWRARGYGFFQGLHLVGDYNSSDYYELDLDTYQDFTGTQRCRRRAPVIHKSYREMTFFNLIVDIEGGLGLLAGQGSDPILLLRYSDDGKSWSDYLEASLGKLGEYNIKATWEQLGMSYERIFEISLTDPIPLTILGAYAEIELGAH